MENNLLVQLLIVVLWIWALVALVKSWGRLKTWAKIVAVIGLVLALGGGVGIDILGLGISIAGIGAVLIALVVIAFGGGSLKVF
jgi:hypothetical protein